MPGLADQSSGDISGGLAREIVREASQRLELDVCAAVGSVVASLDRVGESRAEADRVLDIIARDGHRNVATIADVRSEVLVHETLAMLEAAPAIRDPRVAALVSYDDEHHAGLVQSVLSYLGSLGDVRAAARNTLRYRMKLASSVSDLDLNDPYQACSPTYIY